MKSNLALKITVLLSTLLMICLNLYAEILPVNGITRFEILEQVPAYFLPANYVYNIWYLIYFGLIAFSIFSFFKKDLLNRNIAKWIVVSHIANVAWVYLWHYKMVGLAILCVIAIFTSITLVYIELRKKKYNVIPSGVFSIYLAWMSVAMISNLSVANYLSRGGNYLFSAEATAVGMIYFLTFISLLALKIQKDIIFALVIVWALFGVLERHFTTSDPIVGSIIISFALLLIGILYSIAEKFNPAART